MASKVLYKTRKPEMLRALIGEKLTRDFIEFTKQKVIQVEDVINHNYTEEDLNMTTAESFQTAIGLSRVDEEHFQEVREFMNRVSKEARATFDVIWAGNNEERLEKILVLKKKNY